jgi:hypothetical protein
MRTKLATAGLLAGLATALAPVAPAAANCDPQIIATGPSGCTNGCMETGKRYEEVRDRLGGKVLPSYWDLFACPQTG